MSEDQIHKTEFKFPEKMISVNDEIGIKPELVKTVTPLSDPEAISIELPSNFAYYKFKDLYVKPFRVIHLAKVAKAMETASLQVLAEVVSSVLMTPNGDKNIAFSLSMSDFTCVLYWLRLNSFAKKQMRFTNICSNEKHHEDVDNGLKTKDSLKITTILDKTKLKLNSIVDIPDINNWCWMNGDERVLFRPETVLDTMQFLDSTEWEDPEFQYFAKIAAVLDLPFGLDEKIKFIKDNNIDTDSCARALEFANMMSQYQVVETYTSVCSGCGASMEVNTSVDARSFLSPAF